jgi:hypothetical protein
MQAIWITDSSSHDLREEMSSLNFLSILLNITLALCMNMLQRCWKLTQKMHQNVVRRTTSNMY